MKKNQPKETIKKTPNKVAALSNKLIENMATEKKPAISGIRPLKALLEGSWQIFTYAWEKYLLLFLVSFGASIVFILSIVSVVIVGNLSIPDFSTNPAPSAILPLLIIVGISLLLFIVISIGIGLAVDYYVLSVGEGKPETPKNALRYGFKNIGSYFFVTFLAGLAIFGSTLLFIIPGIIIGLVYSQIVPVFILEGKTGVAALSRSAELTKGYKWEIFTRYFLFYFILIFVNVISYIPYIGTVISFILSFISTPIILAFGYLIYKDLVSLKSASGNN